MTEILFQIPVTLEPAITSRLAATRLRELATRTAPCAHDTAMTNLTVTLPVSHVPNVLTAIVSAWEPNPAIVSKLVDAAILHWEHDSK